MIRGALLVKVLVILIAVLSPGCASRGSMTAADGSDGPANAGVPVPRQDGDARAGKDVFRFETFGNERFWTDAARLPQGLLEAKVTPLQALDLGLQVDVLRVPIPIALRVVKDLILDRTGRKSKVLNDPQTTIRLINANAVIGFSIKDSNGDGILDVTKGDKVGPTCALCHTVTNGLVFKSPNGGSIGFRRDGLANHDLNFGKLVALAANSRALYPLLQLELGGKTLGRAPKGLTPDSTEAEVDAYLSNPAYYPVGMFDDSPDGNGNPMHNTPLFRQDLAAPFGSEGTFARLDNFSNHVFTALFDPTTLTTPGGRAFLRKLGGAAGDEIVDGYVKVLAATGVTGYPFVNAAPHSSPGSEDAPIGLRVDNAKLLDLNAFLAHLKAPRGVNPADPQDYTRGRDVFRTAGCTSCHNVDQSKFVPPFIVPMKTIFPGDSPVVLAERMPPLNPIMDTPGVFFDDKMAVVNASVRGEVRGIAMPLLMDLARKPVFLHDSSVSSLDQLFDPRRGATAPHPFYVAEPRARAFLVEFLRRLDDR